MSLNLNKLANPFEPDIFELDSRRQRAGTHSSIYQLELDEVLELIRQLPRSNSTAGGAAAAWGPGCGLHLLRSRRAGFGKTHFLDSLSGKAGDDAYLIPLRFEAASTFTWAQLLRDTLTGMHLATAWQGRLNGLEDFSRQLFSDMTRELLLTGGIPCANPVQTVAALEKLPPQQVFDFANTNHAIGKWFSRYFEAVLPAARNAITSKEAIPVEDAGSWLARLYAYNQPGAPASGTDRLQQLLDSLPKNLSEDRARELTGQFCQMIVRRRPLAFIVDEVDAFFSDSAAIKSLSALLLGLARQVPQAMVLLSVNEDVWQSGFSAHLPSAWEDRLTAHVVELSTLTEEEAHGLLEQRLLQAGIPVWEASQFLESLDFDGHFGKQKASSLYPRAVIRHAAGQWRQWSKSSHSPKEEAAAAMPQREMGFLDEDLPEIDAEETVEEKTGEPKVAPLELEQENGTATQAEAEATTEAAAVENEAATTAETPETGVDNEAVEIAPEQAPDEAHIEPTVAEAPPEEAEHAQATEEESHKEARAAASPPSFNRLRDMLERLRQSRGEGNVEAMFKEAIVEKEESKEESQEDELSLKYQDLIEVLKQNDAAVQPQELAAVLKMISQGQPVVGYYELDLPTLPGKKVIRWTLENREILFGCEPSNETRFWKLLSDFTARRVAVREGQGKQGNDFPPESRLKLVLPHFGSDAFNAEAWLQEIEAKPSVSGALHVLHLDKETHVRLVAASQLINQVNEQKLEVAPAKLSEFLAKGLSGFWQEITGPLKVEVEQMA